MQTTLLPPLAGYSLAAAGLLHEPGAATAYTYETLGTTQDAAPAIMLGGSVSFAYTDCSGWVNYVLDSVAPVHEAIAAAARLAPQFNLGEVETYVPPGSALPSRALLNEASRSWSRADVLASFFGSAARGNNGFASLADFTQLQAGDLIAYASGIYADPAHTNAAHTPGLMATNDTGHTMIVIGDAVPVPLDGLGKQGTTYEGATVASTLDPAVVAIYAVPVVDCSSLPHFADVVNGSTGQRFMQPADDDRTYAALPADLSGLPSGISRTDLQPGGVGTGTLWFGVDAAGRALQFRFGANDPYFSNPDTSSSSSAKVVISAARLTPTIELAGSMLDAQGYLVVNSFPNAAPVLGGTRYAADEVLSGAGGLRLQGGGTLRLSAGNSYAGGTVIEAGTLQLAGADAAGSGPIIFMPQTEGTISIDPGVTVGNEILGFTDGDVIDLRGLAFTPGLRLEFKDPALEIREGVAAVAALQLGKEGAAQVGVYRYALDDDGLLGSALTLTHGPGAGRFAFSGPHVLGVDEGKAYSGPVGYLAHEYHVVGPAGIAVTARTTDTFIRGSDGNDAIAVLDGRNVLDGAGGSNFLVGGTGTDGGSDTFFVDALRTEPAWDTIVNFHAGDMATMWGLETDRGSWSWSEGQGAQGYEGATLWVTQTGPGASTTFGVTFAGKSVADMHDQSAITSGIVGGHAYTAFHALA